MKAHVRGSIDSCHQHDDLESESVLTSLSDEHACLQRYVEVLQQRLLEQTTDSPASVASSMESEMQLLRLQPP